MGNVEGGETGEVWSNSWGSNDSELEIWSDCVPKAIWPVACMTGGMGQEPTMDRAPSERTEQPKTR